MLRRKSVVKSAVIETIESRQLLSVSIDTGFGNQGSIDVKAALDPSIFQVNAVAALSNGKSLVGGSYNYDITTSRSRGFIARLNADGTRDNTFGPDHNGFVLVTQYAIGGVVDNSFFTSVSRIQVANNGDIYVATPMLGRYSSDGFLDYTYGQDSWPGYSGVSDSNFNLDPSTGDIYIHPSSGWQEVRIDATGRSTNALELPKPDFVQFPSAVSIVGVPNDVAFFDGKLYEYGYVTYFLQIPANADPVYVTHSFVSRYSTSGVLDTSFGTNGVYDFNAIPNTSARSTFEVAAKLAFLNDGRIRVLVTGSSEDNNSNKFILAGVTPDGKKDTTFGSPINDGSASGVTYDGLTAYNLEAGATGTTFVLGTAQPSFDATSIKVIAVSPAGTIDASDVQTLSIRGAEPKMSVDANNHILFTNNFIASTPGEVPTVGRLIYSAPAVVTSTDPDNLTATVLTNKSVKLNWSDNSSNETGFKIERRYENWIWGQVAIVGANTTSYTETGLYPGVVYEYRVRATNASGDSDYSNLAKANMSVVTVSDTSAPSNLKAATSNHQVKLTWKNNTAAATSIVIERRYSNWKWDTTFSASSSATSFTDTSVYAGVEYEYRIKAVTASGDTQYSNLALIRVG